MMIICVFSVDVNRQEQSGIQAGTGTDIGPLVQPLVTWYFKMMVFRNPVSLFPYVAKSQTPS